MKPQLSRIAFLQVLTVILLAVPFVAAAAYVWHRHVLAQSMLADLEPRYARLQGARAMQAELEKSATLAKATMVKHVYPTSLDATKAGNDAQQRIRSVFEDSQVSVESSQVLPPKDVDQFQRIGVSLRVEGNMPAIQEAILKLRDQSPSILIDSLILQNLSPVRPASTPRLAGNFSFSVLRLRS